MKHKKQDLSCQLNSVHPQSPTPDSANLTWHSAVNSIDINPVRSADIVFLQTNKTNHSNYWAVRDACKNRGIPYIHLNFASAKLCAEVIIQEIEKLEHNEEQGN